MMVRKSEGKMEGVGLSVVSDLSEKKSVQSMSSKQGFGGALYLSK